MELEYINNETIGPENLKKKRFERTVFFFETQMTRN